MEIRRKRKKTFSDAILPLGGCIFSIFLVVLLYLHIWLNDRGASKPRIGQMPSRVAEDAQFQLMNRRQINRDDYSDENDDETSSEDDITDPGAMDESLTFSEQSRVQKLRLPKRLETTKELPYDIHKCPPKIPHGYPIAWNVIEVLKHWNPDETKIPDTIHQGLCAIDWSDPQQRKIAVHYRKNEVPFLIKKHPTIWKTADRWSNYEYLHRLLGDKTYRNEHSHDNHMMYWKLRGKRTGPPGWKPPTEDVKKSFPDWRRHAEELEAHPETSATSEHFYLRLNGALGNGNEWLYDELPFFHPRHQNDIFMVDPTDARGINCRLGSRGTIAETHYDMSRNVILILHGQKRYILGHPDQCQNMQLYPNGHPSARHTSINWSDPHSWFHDGKHFAQGMVNEVVLEAGDALYLPTYWFHFIVSLSLNYQCNARSGISYEYQQHIRKCGFR